MAQDQEIEKTSTSITVSIAVPLRDGKVFPCLKAGLPCIMSEVQEMQIEIASQVELLSLELTMHSRIMILMQQAENVYK